MIFNDEGQFLNDSYPMDFTEEGIVMLWRLTQSEKANQSMSVTVVGMTSERIADPLNAFSPMRVTVRPSITEGIIIFDSRPLYPVIVI